MSQAFCAAGWLSRTGKTLLLQVAPALCHLRARHALRPWGVRLACQALTR